MKSVNLKRLLTLLLVITAVNNCSVISVYAVTATAYPGEQDTQTNQDDFDNTWIVSAMLSTDTFRVGEWRATVSGTFASSVTANYYFKVNTTFTTKYSGALITGANYQGGNVYRYDKTTPFLSNYSAVRTVLE